MGDERIPFQTRQVRSLCQLEELAPEWASLLAITPAVSGFQSLGWVRSSWEFLARPGDSLFVTVVTLDQLPVAIFPNQVTRGGHLTFIGTCVSNYCGPLYDPVHLAGVVAAWADCVVSAPHIRSIELVGLREGSPFLDVARSLTLGSWAPPLVVRTNPCPEVDLSAGWEAIHGRHKSKQRSTWKRKERRLARLGDYRFDETEDPEEIASVMPRLFSLFQRRWGGQHITAGFGKGYEGFQIHAARLAGAEGHVRLSLLRLDGEIIAFSYGIRAASVTASYVLAHDDLFSRYSVGLLLLLRVLEAAAGRGDPVYDFSLGETEYKTLWASGERGVFELFWGRGRWMRFALNRARGAARSVPWLRRAKVKGVRLLIPEKLASQGLSDSPGIGVGQGSADGRWYVYRVNPLSKEGIRTARWSFRDMRERLSPRLLEIAIERSFRGDELVVVSDGGAVTGVVWMASGGRRVRVLGGGTDVSAEEPVYYHPIPVDQASPEDLVSTLTQGQPYVVVTPIPLVGREGIRLLNEFVADANLSS